MEEYSKKSYVVLLLSVVALVFGGVFTQIEHGLGILIILIGIALLLYFAWMRSALKKMSKQQEATQALTKPSESKPVQAAVRSTAPTSKIEPPEGLMQFKIAGVTYYNDDGSSRQALIRDIDDRGSDKFSFYFKRYDYGDRPAIAFYCVNEFGIEKMLGNIPSDRREEFERIFDRIIGIKYVDVVGGGGLSYGLRVGVRYRQ